MQKFLLIEDDPDQRFLTTRALKKLSPDARLDVACDGEQAISYLDGTGDYGDRQKHPLPNAILLDLKMPKVDGFQFLEWLRGPAPEHCQGIPVIVMSCSILDRDKERAFSLGANHYVVKSQSLDGLREAISIVRAQCAKASFKMVPNFSSGN
jgi:CheY-like chemotaxis protein